MNRDHVIRRFADHETRIGDPPAVAPRGDRDLNPGMGTANGPRPAAVLVPLVDRPEGLQMLLTRRTDHLEHHPGQISFPGGRIEDGDGPVENGAGALEAALRETEEEIGLDRAHVTVIGRLDDYETRTGFRVTPVVGIVTPPFDLSLDAFEVAEAFEVPLAFLLDPGNHKRHRRTFDGHERFFYAIPYGNHFIWGATAGMIMALYEFLNPQPTPHRPSADP